MIKVRGFTSDNAESLGRQITKFTMDLKEENFIGIKYGMAMPSSDTFMSTRVSALVIYKED